MAFTEQLANVVSKKLTMLNSCTSINPTAAEQELTCQNQALMDEICSLKDCLTRLEIKMGCSPIYFKPPVRQSDKKSTINGPETDSSINISNQPKPKEKPMEKKEALVKPASVDSKPGATGGKAKNPEKSKGNAGEKASAAGDRPIDISRLDFRVGRIIEVWKHPDAESLYVEKVDLAEPNGPRTVVSGLVNFVPIASMQNRLGVFLCNLKPAKMRGVESQGMLMCVSTTGENKSVEPLEIIGDVQPGDRISAEGFFDAPEPVLPPKKKIFEAVKDDLRVNDEGVASYKGIRWIVADRPGVVIKAKTIKDAQIS